MKAMEYSLPKKHGRIQCKDAIEFQRCLTKKMMQITRRRSQTKFASEVVWRGLFGGFWQLL